MRIFLLLTLLVDALVGQAKSHRALVIQHVTVIDMTGALPRPDMTVMIEGDRIATIGSSAEVKAPDTAQRVDGAGKFLVPGLWDMHVRPESGVCLSQGTCPRG